MDLFRRWSDVNGCFEVTKDRRSEWVVYATTQEIQAEVFRLADECGKLMVFKNQKQRYVTLKGEWWAELAHKMAPGLTVPGDQSGHFRDCIFEPAKRSIELLFSIGFNPTSETPTAAVDDFFSREGILQLAPAMDEGPMAGFRWNHNGIVYSGMEPTAWKLCNYLWKQRGKVSYYDDDLALAMFDDHAADIHNVRVGSHRKTANKFFKTTSIPWRVSAPKDFVVLKKFSEK